MWGALLFGFFLFWAAARRFFAHPIPATRRVHFVFGTAVWSQGLGLHASVARRVCCSTFVVGVNASHSTLCLHELLPL